MLRCAPILFVLAAMPAAAAQPPFLARWCAWEDHSGRIQCPLGLDRTARGPVRRADRSGLLLRPEIGRATSRAPWDI